MSKVLYIRTHKDQDLHEKLAKWVKEDPETASVNQLAIKILRTAVNQRYPGQMSSPKPDSQLTFGFNRTDVVLDEDE